MLPLLWEWHHKQYLGAAHGVVGILFTLLYFMSELREVGRRLRVDVIGLVRETVNKLDDLCHPSGNIHSSVGRDRDLLVHWCHGAPGHVLLLVKAHEVWGDAAYLRQAERIALNVVYPRGLLRKGVGLCHGISGNAYVFLAVRRAVRREGSSGDSWARMARMFADFALENLHELEGVPDRPYSLFEGMPALAVLLLDLSSGNLDRAKFPCYEF